MTRTPQSSRTPRQGVGRSPQPEKRRGPHVPPVQTDDVAHHRLPGTQSNGEVASGMPSPRTPLAKRVTSPRTTKTLKKRGLVEERPHSKVDPSVRFVDNLQRTMVDSASQIVSRVGRVTQHGHDEPTTIAMANQRIEVLKSAAKTLIDAVEYTEKSAKGEGRDVATEDLSEMDIQETGLMTLASAVRQKQARERFDDRYSSNIIDINDTLADDSELPDEDHELMKKIMEQNMERIRREVRATFINPWGPAGKGEDGEERNYGRRGPILEAYRRAMNVHTVEGEQAVSAITGADTAIAGMILQDKERRLELKRALDEADHPKKLAPAIWALCDLLQRQEARLCYAHLHLDRVNVRVRGINAELGEFNFGVREGIIGDLRTLKNEVDFLEDEREWLYKKLKVFDLQFQNRLKGGGSSFDAAAEHISKLEAETKRLRKEAFVSKLRNTMLKIRVRKLSGLQPIYEQQLMTMADNLTKAEQMYEQLRRKYMNQLRSFDSANGDAAALAAELEQLLDSRRSYLQKNSLPIRIAVERLKTNEEDFMDDVMRSSGVSRGTAEMREHFVKFCEAVHGQVVSTIMDLSQSLIDDVGPFVDTDMAQRWRQADDPVVALLATRLTLPNLNALYMAASEVLKNNWIGLSRAFAQSGKGLFDGFASALFQMNTAQEKLKEARDELNKMNEHNDTLHAQIANLSGAMRKMTELKLKREALAEEVNKALAKDEYLQEAQADKPEDEVMTIDATNPEVKAWMDKYNLLVQRFNAGQAQSRDKTRRIIEAEAKNRLIGVRSVEVDDENDELRAEVMSLKQRIKELEEGQHQSPRTGVSKLGRSGKSQSFKMLGTESGSSSPRVSRAHTPLPVDDNSRSASRSVSPMPGRAGTPQSGSRSDKKNRPPSGSGSQATRDRESSKSREALAKSTSRSSLKRQTSNTSSKDSASTGLNTSTKVSGGNLKRGQRGASPEQPHRTPSDGPLSGGINMDLPVLTEVEIDSHETTPIGTPQPGSPMVPGKHRRSSTPALTSPLNRGDTSTFDAAALDNGDAQASNAGVPQLSMTLPPTIQDDVMGIEILPPNAAENTAAEKKSGSTTPGSSRARKVPSRSSTATPSKGNASTPLRPKPKRGSQRTPAKESKKGGNSVSSASDATGFETSVEGSSNMLEFSASAMSASGRPPALNPGSASLGLAVPPRDAAAIAPMATTLNHDGSPDDSRSVAMTGVTPGVTQNVSVQSSPWQSHLDNITTAIAAVQASFNVAVQDMSVGPKSTSATPFAASLAGSRQSSRPGTGKTDALTPQSESIKRLEVSVSVAVAAVEAAAAGASNSGIKIPDGDSSVRPGSRDSIRRSLGPFSSPPSSPSHARGSLTPTSRKESLVNRSRSATNVSISLADGAKPDAKQFAACATQTHDISTPSVVFAEIASQTDWRGPLQQQQTSATVGVAHPLQSPGKVRPTRRRSSALESGAPESETSHGDASGATVDPAELLLKNDDQFDVQVFAVDDDDDERVDFGEVAHGNSSGIERKASTSSIREYQSKEPLTSLRAKDVNYSRKAHATGTPLTDESGTVGASLNHGDDIAARAAEAGRLSRAPRDALFDSAQRGPTQKSQGGGVVHTTGTLSTPRQSFSQPSGSIAPATAGLSPRSSAAAAKDAQSNVVGLPPRPQESGPARTPVSQSPTTTPSANGGSSPPPYRSTEETFPAEWPPRGSQRGSLLSSISSPVSPNEPNQRFAARRDTMHTNFEVTFADDLPGGYRVAYSNLVIETFSLHRTLGKLFTLMIKVFQMPFAYEEAPMASELYHALRMSSLESPMALSVMGAFCCKSAFVDRSLSVRLRKGLEAKLEGVANQSAFPTSDKHQGTTLLENADASDFVTRRSTVAPFSQQPSRMMTPELTSPVKPAPSIPTKTGTLPSAQRGRSPPRARGQSIFDRDSLHRIKSGAEAGIVVPLQGAGVPPRSTSPSKKPTPKQHHHAVRLRPMLDVFPQGTALTPQAKQVVSQKRAESR